MMRLKLAGAFTNPNGIVKNWYPARPPLRSTAPEEWREDHGLSFQIEVEFEFEFESLLPK